MSKEKMKTLLFTIVMVTPIAYLHKVMFPETSRGTAFLVIVILLIIFHLIGRWIFSRKGKADKG